MNNSLRVLLCGVIAAWTFSAFAAPQPCANKKLGPACLQICNACQNAGFIVGEANIGDGFWVDCIAPIMTGNPEPAKAVKANHIIPAAPGGNWAPVASQCQATNPGWGIPKPKASK